MTTDTQTPQITLLADTVADLDHAIARIQAARVVAEGDPASTPEDTLYRTRLTQSLRTLRVVRAGLVGLNVVLAGQVAP